MNEIESFAHWLINTFDAAFKNGTAERRELVEFDNLCFGRDWDLRDTGDEDKVKVASMSEIQSCYDYTKEVIVVESEQDFEDNFRQCFETILSGRNVAIEYNSDISETCLRWFKLYDVIYGIFLSLCHKGAGSDSKLNIVQMAEEDVVFAYKLFLEEDQRRFGIGNLVFKFDNEGVDHLWETIKDGDAVIQCMADISGILSNRLSYRSALARTGINKYASTFFMSLVNPILSAAALSNWEFQEGCHNIFPLNTANAAYVRLREIIRKDFSDKEWSWVKNYIILDKNYEERTLDAFDEFVSKYTKMVNLTHVFWNDVDYPIDSAVNKEYITDMIAFKKKREIRYD